MRFQSKSEALIHLNDENVLVCRDSTRQLENGKYSGGKVFCACPGVPALTEHVGRLRRYQRHMYEHVGHRPAQPLAPYLDVELLLQQEAESHCNHIIQVYVDAALAALHPVAPGLRAAEHVCVGTAIARLPVHRNAAGKLRKGTAGNACEKDAGTALLLSFHLKVHAPGVYFCGNAQQAAFWRMSSNMMEARVRPHAMQWLADPHAIQACAGEFGAGWFDHLVYNERPWRLLYNSKISDPTRVLRPWPPLGDSRDEWDPALLERHMVTQVTEDSSGASAFRALALPAPTARVHGGSHLLAHVSESMSPAFRRILLPHRLSHEVSHKQQVATHHWPPNGPALYFAVPPEQWSAVEDALWASASAAPPPLLAYCYARRRHALQLDIDKCPAPLHAVARACHAALRRAGALADEDAMAVERSPPKPGKPGLAYARVTFPSVVVDEDLSALLKVACAEACAARWPEISLDTWVNDIMDPQSRGARTHHSAKDGALDRVSRIVGVWNGDEMCPQLPTDRAAFCPLRPPGAPLVALSAASRAALEAARARAASGRGGRFKSHFQTLRVEGGVVHAGFPSAPPAAALERRVLALWEVVQATAYFRAHPFRFTYVYERLSLNSAQPPAYQCFTNSHRCPFREKEPRAVEGHAPGPAHASVGHMAVWVDARGVELRCCAKWHTVRTRKSLLTTDAPAARRAWEAHHALLFRGLPAPAPAPPAPFVNGRGTRRPNARQKKNIQRQLLISEKLSAIKRQRLRF